MGFLTKPRAFATKARRLAAWLWPWPLLSIVVLTLIFLYPANYDSINAPATIRLEFGYSRANLTRTSGVPLCRGSVDQQKNAPALAGGDANAPIWPSDRFPECPEYEGPGKGTRPAVVSAIAEGDLNQVAIYGDQTVSCSPGQTGPQFPSSQITVTASNSGVADIAISVGANPLTPEEVHPGTYCGTILINRTPIEGATNIENPIRLPISVHLSNRTQLPILLRVAAALLLGGLLGGGIKWISDNLGTLAAADRRYRRLMALALGYHKYLPDPVKRATKALRAGLDARDVAQIAEATTQLEPYDSQLGLLARWATATRDLETAIQRINALLQSKPPTVAIPDSVKQALTRLDAVLKDRRRTDPVDLQTDQGATQAQAAIRLTSAVTKYVQKQYEQSEKELGMAASHVLETIAAPLSDSQQPTTGSSDDPNDQPAGQLREDVSSDEHQDHPSGKESTKSGEKKKWSPINWAMHHPSFFILALTAGVTAFFGVSSQFINDTTFTDAFLDYFALFSWAFVGLIAGGSLVDIVTRLNTPTAARTTR